MKIYNFNEELRFLWKILILMKSWDFTKSCDFMKSYNFSNKAQ